MAIVKRPFPRAAIAVVAIFAGLGAQAPAKAPAVDAPYPVLVTAATRQDAKALQRLQTPGKVVFQDGFDGEASLQAYFEVNGRKEGRARVTKEQAVVHTGAGALQLCSTDSAGKSCGAGPVLWLGNDGYERLYLRYYIRYAADYDQGNLNHTGGGLSGVAGNDKWRGMGTAGLRPGGDDHCSTRVEGWRDWQRVPSPGYLFCYTYWMDMRQDRDGHFWGNMLGPEMQERFVPPRGQWLCVELMVGLNQVDRQDGELAVWLDGVLYEHMQGFRWRSSAEVKLKRAGLQVYVHEARRDNTVWFDDLVVSTGYIGPLAARRGEAKKETGR
jgi:hypothetical protein